MDEREVIEALANYFGIEPDEETGEYNLKSYDWISGCSMGNGSDHWLTLANVIEALREGGLI